MTPEQDASYYRSKYCEEIVKNEQLFHKCADLEKRLHHSLMFIREVLNTAWERDVLDKFTSWKQTSTELMGMDKK